uniref:Odorant receptor n=1 Tax=Anopheles atroparvus TaxID=41427 RepID=A0AAG5CSK4_ANOAO
MLCWKKPSLVRCYFCTCRRSFPSESEAVATAIFQSSWYARSNQQQRDLSFVMARAQRPVKLTAAKLFIVTRISFTQVLKQAYTIFTLMSQFLDDAIN